MNHISVIIPLFNKEAHIKRAVLSVLNQTYQHFELIIVNDGSTDNSQEVVNSIKDERIKLIEQNNKGVSAARNKGVAQSKYELIAFLDADDEWSPLFLEKLIKMNNKHPEAGMIGTAYTAVRDNKKYNVDFYNVPENMGIIDNYFEAAIKRNPTCSSAVMMYKSVFNELEGFPVNLRRGEDSFMWGKIALNYPIGFINEPLAIRYYDSDNRASKKDEIIDEFPLLDYIEKSNIKIDEKTFIYVKEFIYQKYIARAIQSFKVGKKKQAKELLLKARGTKEFRLNYIKLRILSFLPKNIIYKIFKYRSL